jgi:hypothetical protein
MGKFSLTDAHNWISICLPDIPPNTSVEEEDQTHYFSFKSTFIGTVVNLSLKKGMI